MKKAAQEFRVLVVDDEPDYRESLRMILQEKGYDVALAEGGAEALDLLRQSRFNLVLSDLMMQGMNGIQLLQEVRRLWPQTAVIILTGYGTIENAVEAMKIGAWSYFVKGHDPIDLLREVEKVRLHLPGQTAEKIQPAVQSTDVFLQTQNPQFRRMIDLAERAAQSNVSILLLGESGVGKDVFARYIHSCSDRRDGRFVPVNCQAFAGGLLESELFGHEKGSFTGAVERRKGRFEMAHGGTLFLDEVGDVPLGTQVKLLRTLESKTIERLGSSEPLLVDFRLISATNKKPEEEIRAGRIREDFFYRISTITIEIPSLRSRKEDLPLLIDYFMEKSQLDLGKTITGMEAGVREFLLAHHYPGNVRELKNIIERLVVLARDGVILRSDLPDLMEKAPEKAAEKIPEKSDDDTFRQLKEIRREGEADYIQKVLQHCDYKMIEAAKCLGISRRQLFNKISEYGLKTNR